MIKSILTSLVLAIGLLFTGCKKEKVENNCGWVYWNNLDENPNKNPSDYNVQIWVDINGIETRKVFAIPTDLRDEYKDLDYGDGVCFPQHLVGIVD